MASQKTGANMYNEEQRLKSFGQNWPFKGKVKCIPKKLAEAGFYYTGTTDSIDAVRCFMCNKDLDGWERNDDPMAEHQKHAPQCPFLNFEVEANRLLTFNTWPHRNHTASPDEFARVGFIHIPSDDADDQVKCFSCKKQLSGWMPEDDPLQEHIDHSKKCTFVKSLSPKTSPAPSAAPLQPASAAPSPSSSSFTAQTVSADAIAPQTAAKTSASKPLEQRTTTTQNTLQTTEIATTKAMLPVECPPTVAKSGAVAQQSKTLDGFKAPPPLAAVPAVPSSTLRRIPLKDKNAAAQAPGTVQKTKRSVDPLDQDIDLSTMTVEQYLRAFYEAQGHMFQRAVDKRVEDFKTKATSTRAAITALYTV